MHCIFLKFGQGLILFYMNLDTRLITSIHVFPRYSLLHGILQLRTARWQVCPRPPAHYWVNTRESGSSTDGKDSSINHDKGSQPFYIWYSSSCNDIINIRGTKSSSQSPDIHFVCYFLWTWLQYIPTNMDAINTFLCFVVVRNRLQ